MIPLVIDKIILNFDFAGTSIEHGIPYFKKFFMINIYIIIKKMLKILIVFELWALAFLTVTVQDTGGTFGTK